MSWLDYLGLVFTTIGAILILISLCLRSRCDEVAELRRELKKIAGYLNIEESLNADLSQNLEKRDKLILRAAELLRDDIHDLPWHEERDQLLKDLEKK